MATTTVHSVNTERVTVCGCVWVGELPATPMADWSTPDNQTLVCGCSWYGQEPTLAEWAGL